MARASVENSHGNLSATNISDSTLMLRHGNASIASSQGKIHFEGSHGNVVADTIEGDLVIEASHMGIEVSRVTQAADISTSHNDIIVKGVVGAATIDNEHGDIKAVDMIGNVTASNSHGDTVILTSGERVEVHSRHGEVEIEIESPEFQSIVAETTHDDIRLWLPESVKASIETTASHGDTDSEFESAAESSKRVSLKTQHGNIQIKARIAVSE